MRITMTLEGNVHTQVTAINNALKPGPHSIPTSVADHIYEKIYGKYIEAMEKLPPDFFKYAETLYVARFEKMSVAVDIKLSRARPFPHAPVKGLHSAVSGQWASYPNWVTLEHSPDWDDVRSAFSVYHASKIAADAQATKFADFVRKLMEMNGTVTRCVAAWPAFLELLPENVRLAYKSGKRRKVKCHIPEGFDVDAMTARVTAYKFTKQVGS